MRESVRKVNIASYITLILAFLVVGVAIFWLAYPYKTADVVEPIKVLNPHHKVRPNESIIMELRITKHNLYPVSTHNSILCDNGRVYTISSMTPQGQSSLPVGTFTRIQRSYSLPGDAEIGTICHFEFQNTYEVNPIRSVIQTWKSENFRVIR